MSDPELAEFIQRHALTGGFNADEIDKLIARLQRREFSAGSVLCQQGDTNLGLFLIWRGRVEISQRQTGQEHETVIAKLEAPTVVGEMEIISGLPNVCSVRAQTDVVAFLLSADTVRERIFIGDKAVRKIMRNIARVLVRRLIDTNRRYLAAIGPKGDGELTDTLTGWD